MAAGGSKSEMMFLWLFNPVKSDDVEFHHPCEMPIDETVSRRLFVDGKRGPQGSRISKVVPVEKNSTTWLVAERGVTKEVPKTLLLPWYEGLLLLQEIEARRGKQGSVCVDWMDADLRRLLAEERGKRQLSAALYVERKLIHIAVTGAAVTDAEGRNWIHRRELEKADDGVTFAEVAEGRDAKGNFSVREVTGYLPPWEAFCHDKCGLYQDFYQVRWGGLAADVDYSNVENGCPTVAGTTWEPDECIPPDLDSLRIQAKREWIQFRKEHEQREFLKRQGQSSAQTERKQPLLVSTRETGPCSKKQRVQLGTQVPRATKKRDNTQLDPDLFLLQHGHDFPTVSSTKFTDICSGWPKTKAEYPEGYGPAQPPGMCWQSCDCMDGERLQELWETEKDWIEDPQRSADAKQCIQNFADRKDMVVRHGQFARMGGNNLHYFSTTETELHKPMHAKAAGALASFMTTIIRGVLGVIPISSLTSAEADAGEPVIIPACVFLLQYDEQGVPTSNDVLPLQFFAKTTAGGSLPDWVDVDAETGKLTLRNPPAGEGCQLRLELRHMEGTVATAKVGLVPPADAGPQGPGQRVWVQGTAAIYKEFVELTTANDLDNEVQKIILDHLSELYNVRGEIAKEQPLGDWLREVVCMLRMLRSATVGTLHCTGEHHERHQDRARVSHSRNVCR